MYSLLLSRISLVWFLLVAATVLSWELGHGFGFNDSRQAGAAIILVSLIKVRYVILDFMEVRHAPRLMRFIAECWGILLCIILITLYLC